MKKKLVKTLKQMEIAISNKKHSVEMYQCDCCSDFTGVITHKKSGEKIIHLIESAQDYFEFMSMFKVVTGDDLIPTTMVMKEYSDKKWDKLVDNFFECLDKEYETLEN